MKTATRFPFICSISNICVMAANMRRACSRLPAARAAWLVQRPPLAPRCERRTDKLLAASLAAETWDWVADYKRAYAPAEASS